MNDTTLNLLKRATIEIAYPIYTLISLTNENWFELIENPELSPRMTEPFMIFKDKFEITLLLDEIDFGKIRNEIPKAKIESGFRLLTFDVVLDFTVVGFLAEITKILSEAEISIIALSAFSRDHILIKQENLAKALKVLGDYVEELC
jgi:hypothetical protein